MGNTEWVHEVTLHAHNTETLLSKVENNGGSMELMEALAQASTAMDTALKIAEKEEEA